MNDTYNILCRFLAGSDAHGCYYVLIGDDNMTSITGFVVRGNKDTGIIQVEIPDFQSYSEIVAYELDSSNKTVYTLNPIRNADIFEVVTSRTCLTLPGKFVLRKILLFTKSNFFC